MRTYIRIGDLAKQAGVTLSALDYWVTQGKLKVAGWTVGGHRLFDVDAAMRRVGRLRQTKLRIK